MFFSLQYNFSFLYLNYYTYFTTFIHRQDDKETEKQRDRKTKRQKNKETERQIDTD